LKTAKALSKVKNSNIKKKRAEIFKKKSNEKAKHHKNTQNVKRNL